MTTFALYKSSASEAELHIAPQSGGQSPMLRSALLCFAPHCGELCSSKPYSGLLFIFLIQKELGKLRGV
jgi:hypothetical protein